MTHCLFSWLPPLFPWLAWAMGLLLCSSLHAGGDVFTLMGDLPGGGHQTKGFAISSDGSVVVGSAFNADGFMAVRWTQAGGLEELGDLPGGVMESVAYGVSPDGQIIVGRSASGAAPQGGREAFLWQNGDMIGLGFLSPGWLMYSFAGDVSNDGVAVGQSIDGDTSSFRPFRWSAGVLTGLPDHMGGTGDGFAWGISADGSRIAGSVSAPLGDEIAVWEGGAITSLGDEPGGSHHSGALSLSPSGQYVAGFVGTGSGHEGFVWHASTGRVAIGDIDGGAYFSELWSVSDTGVAVGIASSVHGDEAIVWDACHGMRTLRSLIETQGRSLAEYWSITARAISADGLTVTGWAMRDGALEGYVARLPVPHGGDIDGDGSVGLIDLAAFLAEFGACDGLDCPAAGDIDRDGCVDVGDLALLLNSFGELR